MLQIVDHQSKVIPQTKAATIIITREAGLASRKRYIGQVKVMRIRKRIGFLSFIFIPISEPTRYPIVSQEITPAQDFAP